MRGLILYGRALRPVITAARVRRRCSSAMLRDWL